MRFVANRSITIVGFVAEANPNITAPTGKTYVVRDRNPNGGDVSGLGISTVFSKASPSGTFEDDVSTASISFVLWTKDTTGNDWVRMTADTAIHRLFKTTADLRGPAEVFIQVTAIANVASADTVNLRLTEI